MGMFTNFSESGRLVTAEAHETFANIFENIGILVIREHAEHLCTKQFYVKQLCKSHECCSEAVGFPHHKLGKRTSMYCPAKG